MDVPSTVSVIIGAVAVTVSLFAFWMAWLTARESRENFQRTRDTLAEIDKKAAVIEKVVAENQRELLDTVKQLVIPEKSSEAEKKFFRGLIGDIAKAIFSGNGSDSRRVRDEGAVLAGQADQPQLNRGDAEGED